MNLLVESASTMHEASNFYRTIAWRFMPLLLLCYIFAHLDRINIGFAKLQMTQDLHFSNTTYGLGAGLFFVSYALFCVPCSMMLDRLGPRRWIAIMMVSWGAISTSMMFVKTPEGFYILRFLLGMAEAGFFPSILVYLNRWFPTSRRASFTALFAIAIPLAGVFGGPVSGWILQLFQDNQHLRGWQWMFLLEGAPVILLGILVLKLLPDGFEHVQWLDDAQKNLIRSELSAEDSSKSVTSVAGIVRNPYLWLLVFVYFAVMLSVNTIAFWMPTLIQVAGVTRDSDIGMLSAIPYLAGCVFMILAGRSCDRHKERRWHLFVPLAMCSLGLAIAATTSQHLVGVMVGMILAGMGASSALPMFWQIPPAFLSSGTQAAGIALISSLGAVASFSAPYFIGWMRDATQSTNLALYVLATLIGLGALLVFTVPARLANPKA